MLVVPSERISTNIVVLPVARWSRTRFYAIDRSRSISFSSHTRRTYTKLHPRFGSFDGVFDHTDHKVVDRATPILARHTIARRLVLLLVVFVFITLIMEIIIKDYTINIVVFYYVRHYLAYLLTHFRQRRVKRCDISTLHEPLRMCVVIILRIIFSISSIRACIAIWINPSMHLDSLKVSIVH